MSTCIVTSSTKNAEIDSGNTIFEYHYSFHLIASDIKWALYYSLANFLDFPQGINVGFYPR